mgnify:CR=1 FL=1
MTWSDLIYRILSRFYQEPLTAVLALVAFAVVCVCLAIPLNSLTLFYYNSASDEDEEDKP